MRNILLLVSAIMLIAFCTGYGETGNIASSDAKLSASTRAIQYNGYVEDDIVATAGNGIRDDLMVLRPLDASYCKRPSIGGATYPLSKEGLMFVSSDVYRNNMLSKGYPLNMYGFKTVFSSESNSSIKNTVPYSSGYTQPTKMYFLTYHEHLPIEMRIKSAYANNVGISQNAAQSYNIGCYEMMSDRTGVDTSQNRYWIFVHEVVIYKDALLMMWTKQKRNFSSTVDEGERKWAFIVRQGTTTDWTNTLIENGFN